MRNSLKIVIVFLIILFSLSFFGCKKEEKLIGVAFSSKLGQTVAPMIYKKEEHPTLPANPLEAGFIFHGWFLDDLTFKIPFTSNFDLNTLSEDHLVVYAKWDTLSHTITFNSNGGSHVASITYSPLQSSFIKPADPLKEGYEFQGWFKDFNLTVSYRFDTPPSVSFTVYAKWETAKEKTNPLYTETLPIFSSLYGNTNGNLNNKGLAAYDAKRGVHYFSYQASLYAYNPATDETHLIFTMATSGRPTFINVDKDMLYFIDSYDGFLVSYDLIHETFETLSETENTYASRAQTWLYFTYPTQMYETDYLAFQRYLTNTKTLSDAKYGFEQLNIDGTRVYYKPVNGVSLNVMNYDGQGKSTIFNLSDADVTDQIETLLYKVDNDMISYFALILNIKSERGLYVYNSNDGLVKIMSSSGSSLHSLNYDGTHLYVILNQTLYQINAVTHQTNALLNLPEKSTYLQVINRWFYIGNESNTMIYRIDPVTYETVEVIN